ncbi:MAG: Hsp20/alpha crystallin family protein [Patescibacteria group bacterium]|nr:Hsp20/alpha crystallin family protein [Patescibacteria group bacterium]
MANIFKTLVGLSNDKKIDAENNNFFSDEKTINNSDENNTEEKWLDSDDYEEGQLSIDVFQTPDKLVITSTIAGVKPDNIDISINNDMLTIRGKREASHEVDDANFLYRECYWGSFSRSIILPVEIEADKIEASLENGVLTVILPKAKSAKQIFIKVQEK